MIGYGRKHYSFGYGQAFGGSFGRGWCRLRPFAVRHPEDFTYLGPCRCGFGPNAFWQEKKTGHIFRGLLPYGAWFEAIYSGSSREISADELKAELDWLKKEKENLERKIQEVEESLKGKNSKN